jgi:manganese transport protein
LLFNIPLVSGMVLTAAATYGILLLDHWGFRPTEIVLAGFVAVIGGCYVIELAIVPVDWGAAGAGFLVPKLTDSTAIALAAGIVGATVMPHALFLHSGLTQNRIAARTASERTLLVRFSNREVVFALAMAGGINAAMVLIAAASLSGIDGDNATISSAYRMLGPLIGPTAAILFVVSLIASGISSSVVGTMAGQIVMQGFIRGRIPVWVRRLVTMAPAFIVVGMGFQAEHALVLSQIVLSLALPVPMIPLLLFTRRHDIMGPLANRKLTNLAAIGATVLVISLDVILLAASALD